MATAWGRDRARNFYLIFALMAVAAVGIGFSTTYFLPGARGSLNIPWVVHIHGWAAFAWVVFLTAQVMLVRSKRSRLHRQVGKAAIPLALVIWSTGIAVGMWAAQRDQPSQGDFAVTALGGTASSLTMFLVLVIAGVALRRRPDWHKRVMLIATVVVLWPAFFRFRHLMPFVPRPELWLGLFLAQVPVVIGAWRDYIRWGEVHPAWKWLGSAVFVEQAFELWAFGNGVMTPLGRAIYSLLS